MIDRISTNSSVPIKPVEQLDPAEKSVMEPKAEGKDVAEISSLTQQYVQYMQTMGKLPDVREDVVQKIKEQMGSNVQWPPIIVVDGIAKLIGEKSIADIGNLGKENS